MDPPADPELHPEAQTSMDFLDGLGLGDETSNSPHSDGQEENSSQPLDEEQEDDNGNEL